MRIRGRLHAATPRATSVLLAAVVASAFVVPSLEASGAAPVKKTVKKQVTKAFGRALRGTLEEDELVRWGAVEMSMGQADVAIGTFGPFSLSTRCQDVDPTAAVSLRGTVLLSTTEDHSAISSYADEDADWLVSENPHLIGYTPSGDSPGDPPAAESYYIEGWASAPTGATLRVYSDTATNFSGADCWFAGDLTVQSEA